MKRREFNRILFALPASLLLRRTGLAAGSQPTPQFPTVVDTHAHLFERSLPLAASRRYAPDYDATLADYLGQLDAHGTTHGVLVQPSFLGTDNRYLLAALQQQPQRLRGIVVVEPTISPEELARLDAAGVVGIRLNLMGTALPDLQQAPWPALLRQLAARGWLVEVQRNAGDLPAVVDSLVAAGVNVVVDHFGRPDPALGIDDPGFRYLLKVAATRRVWLKLSGSYRNGTNGVGDAIARAAIPPLRAAFGPDRLLWGSDWPHTQFEKATNYATARRQLDEWITDPAERAAILGPTPAALYHF